ncbi:hypothetical protein [Flavobacterium rivuli]|uniref:hypothetical protein n=1 Tax=Flavobacterium rivuli TaxID=498301 RepID=UPI0003639408|nr:hypothetical protein [Flavobacterium rivuli]
MTTNFEKQALQYKYLWPENDTNDTEPQFDDEDIIDRRNGYHVLSFINRFLAVHGLTNLGSFHKLEWMICKYLPQDLYYRHEIEDWLRKNWGQKVYFY